jgi:pSer/pThr/pTyr-binding forkhead associated (FHA) protein
VDDAAVSREHATISFEGGQFIVEDAGSSSGTIVEGSPAAQTVLASGSSIQLGETELVFMQAEGTFAPAIGGRSATGTGGQQPGETVVIQPQAAAVMAWLAVTAGPEKGKTHQLTAADTTIGRDTTNDFVLADAAVSRRHVMLKYQDDKFILIDVGSAGGTKVNNQPVTGKSLAAGGIIQIGQTQLTLVDVEAGTAPQASASDATMVSQPESGGGVLIVQSGPDAGKSFPLVQGENTIGRDNDCQIILTDQTVSRQHAMVRRQEDSCTVHDLGSRTGTRVDGETLTELTLSSGDAISIGRSELTLMQVEQPQ